jgi:glutamyl-tRNA reductase
MNLLLAGISHKTAPLEVRERFAIAEGQLPGALAQLSADPDFVEALIISTCNRVELIVVAREGVEGIDGLRRFVGSYFGLRWDDFSPYFYVHRGDKAVRHMFRVAAGLDSLVIGEPQVLGQVRKACAVAREEGTIASTLGPVLDRVFSVAKRVRTETRIAEAPVSVSSAAVELAERALGDLHGRSVMIIGAGQMGELAARHLVSKGAATVLVSNRTYAHAVALAEEFRGLAVRFHEIWEAMKSADIVISSTGCPHYILTREDIRRAMLERGGRPLFVVDIAVPRDIDPTVAEIPGCGLANIDDLKEVAEHNLRQREESVEAAERIVAEELAHLRQRRESQRVGPTIISLRKRIEEIRRAELARTREQFGELTSEQEEVLESLTQGLVNKILHTPFAELKQAAARPGRSAFVGAVRSIFRLEEEPAESTLVMNSRC